MKKSTEKIINQLQERYLPLSNCSKAIQNAVNEIIKCYQSKGKLLVCGNGGSAADSEHIVGELMKGFLLDRRLENDNQIKLKAMFPETADYLINNLQGAMPAISLVSQTALMTAFANDKAPDLSFAQQVLGYGNKGDVLIAISTSGNSKNVVYASQIARFKDMNVIALTGQDGGRMKDLADILINVPSNETFEIQEYHLPIYHALCACAENEFFSKED